MAKNVSEVGLKLNDQFSARMKRAGGVVATFARGIKSSMAGVGRAFSMVTAPVRGMMRTVMNLRTVLAGFAAFKLTEFAVSIEGTERHFRVLLEAIGEDAPKMLARLRAAFHGTVSDIDLMRQTNEALTLEAVKSGDQLEMLATLARRLGRAMGVDMNTAFKSLIVGIARQSRLWLDNVGIIVKVEDANRKLAQQLGTTVDKLTDAEKRQGFMNAVVEAAQRKLQMLGEDVESVADSWAKLGATVKNLATDMMKSWSPVLRDIFDKLRNWLVDNRSRIYRFGADILRVADRVLPPIIQKLEQIAAAAWEIVRPLLEIRRLFADFEMGKAAEDLERAAANFQDAAVAANRRRGGMLGGPPTGGYSAHLPVDPSDFGVRRSMERWEDYINRILESGLLSRDQTVVRRLEAAIKAKAEADRQYLTLIGKAVGAGPKGEVGPSILEQGARILDEGAKRREKEDWLAVQDQMEGEAQRRLLFAHEMRRRVRGPLHEGEIQQFETLAEKIESLTVPTSHVKTGFDGLVDGLRRIYEVGTDTFTQIRDLVTHTGDLLDDRLADSLTQIAMRTKDAGQAFKEMATSIIADLTRMIIKMMLMRALTAGIGMLGGNLGPERIPFQAGPGMRLGTRQRGGVAGPYEPTIGGEGARPEAFVPLPDGRTIPVTLSGAGGGQTVINYYRIDATDAQSFDRLFVQSMGRNQDAVGLVHKRQYQDRPALRRAYS